MTAASRKARDAPPSGEGRLGPVLGFTFLYLGGATLMAVLGGNTEFLFYIAVMLILMGALWPVHRQVRLSIGVLWGLSIWGLAHMAGGLLPVPEGWPVQGDVPVLYSAWILPGRLKFDHLVHAYGFAVTTWLCWQGLQAAIRHRGGVATPTFGLLVLAAAASLGFGALNEVVEFIAVLLVPETNVGGYVNTGWDLVANLVGACAAATLIAWNHRRSGTPGALQDTIFELPPTLREKT